MRAESKKNKRRVVYLSEAFICPLKLVAQTNLAILQKLWQIKRSRNRVQDHGTTQWNKAIKETAIAHFNCSANCY